MNDEIRIGSIVCRNEHLVTLEDMHITSYWRNEGSALCTLYLKNLKTGKEEEIDIWFDFDTDQDTDIGYDLDPDDPGTKYIKSINIYKDRMYYQPNKLDTSVVRRCARKFNMSEGQIYDLIKYTANTLRDSFKSDINKQLMEEYEDTTIEYEGPTSFSDSIIFIDDDEEKKDYHLDDSIKLEDDSLLTSFSTTIPNEHDNPVRFTIYVYTSIKEGLPTDIDFYGEIFGLGQKYQFTISPNTLILSSEGDHLINIEDICEELEIDDNSFWKGINEVYDKAEVYLARKLGLKDSRYVKDKNRNMPKQKIDLKSISDRPTIDILPEIIENKNSEPIFITIDDYKFLNSDFENARFYGTIELQGINTEKTYSFDIMFNSYEFKDENGKPIDMLTLCKELKINTGTLGNTLDELKKEAQPYIIRRFYFGY